MNGLTEHDAGTILLNAVICKNPEQMDYYISLLKRRFYEWERKLIELKLIVNWRGSAQECMGSREWTTDIFEVFWNEVARSYPFINAASFPSAKILEIKQNLWRSISAFQD